VNESEIVSQLAAIFARPGEASAGVVVGIGDDAALIAPTRAPLAVTTDIAIEGVHFSFDWSTPFEIGSKIATANLADICAMGGWPQYLVVATGIPKNSEDVIFEIARGIAAEADRVGARVIGGDLSQSEKAMITITALGSVDKPILRSSAHVGDSVSISAITGWSRAGQLIRESQDKELTNSKAGIKALSQFSQPQPDYEVMKRIAQSATAMCDISDGILRDASRIAEASGVTIECDPDLIEKVPGFGELVEIAKKIGVDPIELFLQSGEEHELLFTGPAPTDSVFGSVIGRVIERADSPIVIKGRALPENLGWAHF
jgi:thiamine-monophosphate kinase